MRDLSELTVDEARSLRGLLFDLDDTFLSHGLLTREAYGALWKLADAKLRLVAVTGRPSGWGEVVARQCKGAAPDARFVYQLLASTGICVVPLTGFYTPHPGFRFTLLESDDAKRAWIFGTLAEALATYLSNDKGSA